MKEGECIGIFDSGIGGFSVYKKIKEITTANCVYYGDCLRAPYGNREEEEIVLFIKDDIKFLQEEGATYFVNACNSMSVITTDALLKECGIPHTQYTDMIRSFDKHASCQKEDVVLVLATKATIRSGVYQDVLTKKGVTVFTYVYESLAEKIEKNTREEELYVTIEKGIVYAQEIGATHIVYGCTHYPLVDHLFKIAQKNLVWRGVFVDPAVYVAEAVKLWNLQGSRNFSPHSSKDTPAFIRTMVEML